MSTRATASFDVTGWDQAPYGESDDGPHLARATVKKTFRGELDGESAAVLLLCQSDPDDLGAGAGYVASERVVGRLGERSGTFVFQHGGLSGAGTAPYTFGHVVPGSGTGDLVGLHGTVEIQQSPDGDHTLVLDYDFES